MFVYIPLAHPAVLKVALLSLHFTILAFEGIVLYHESRKCNFSFIAHKAVKDYGCNIKKVSNKKEGYFYKSYE